jgi:GNAT superfamily N-acetyltransferase
MSNEIIVPFDETLLRLPSSLALHAQLRPNLTNFTSEDYLQLTQQLHVCGIIRKTGFETTVVALAAYRYHLATYDTVRFEIDDLIVDEKERNHGLGTRLLHYLIEQAKQHSVTQILIHCDPTNTNAHRFFFHVGLTIMVFEFDLRNFQLLPSNDQIHVIDITDVPEKENEQLLIQSHEIYRQLRPHLPTDQQAYIKQIRDICRTGPARIIVAISNDEKKEILGLSLYRVTRNVNYSKHIYCDDLVTNENKRSSGVGRCLINYMKNEGKKLGIDRLTLDSGCQRGRAHRFYYREGFIISQFGFSMLI